MNRDFIDFVEGAKNAYFGNVLISREKASNGWQYIHITIDDIEVYKFWYSSTEKKSDKPKHTGGKKSYTKLMTESLEKYNNLSLEAYGFLVKLSSFIAWETNTLINKRTKKSLNVDDFVKLTKKSKPTIIKIIKELKENKLLESSKKGYVVSKDLLQKGGK
jgi:Fic family protein